MRSVWSVWFVAALLTLSACVNQEPKAASTGEPPQAAPKAETAAAKAETAAAKTESTAAKAGTAKPAAPASAETSAAEKPAAAAAVAKKPATVASASQHFTNDRGIAIIKESEGLRLEAYSYAGQWLIGYGHSATAKSGMKITEAQAEDLLRQDLGVCEKAIADAVTVPVSANAFSAMASLCYNIGWQKFAASSVVKRLNAGDREGAADAFLMWTKGTINGERVSLPHLEVRRQRERALFLSEEENA
jgi:lysozyme